MKKNIFLIVFVLCANFLFSQNDNCNASVAFCGSNSANPTTQTLIYDNTFGQPFSPGIACLGLIRNPTWFYLKVDTGGTLAYDIIQNTTFNAAGDPIGVGPLNELDVDFAAWGPFSSPSGNCSSLYGNPVCTPTACPTNIGIGGAYPIGNLIDCSYSSAAIETLTINGATIGQYYLILVTNFNGAQGKIKLQQRTFDPSGVPYPLPGYSDCDIVCGVTLGADITECDSTPVPLTATFASPPTTGTPTYVWRLNGVIQPLYTTQTISVNQAGTWSVTTTRPGGCFEVSDAMDVIYLPDIPVNSPVNLSDCGTLPYVFPTINQNLVISSGYSLTDYSEIYYTDRTTAENGDLSGPNVIAPASLINYAITISPVTIWVRIEDRNTGCYVITPIVLSVSASPTGSIAYSGSPFCTGTTTAQPMTGTVTSNGQYTYATIPLGGPGILSLDLNTGAINPSLSTPGNFTVNYDINTPSCGFFHRDVTVTINASPVISPVVAGTLSICSNATTQLAATTLPSLTTPWLSSNPAIATISNTGLVTGVAAGTVIITYTNINGCQDTENITINALPVISNAVVSVCVSNSITLSAINTPATISPWLSSNPAIATISNTGVVSG
uniref:Ig-like domain-containing protein n=1 Tax=Flavobacterium sp. TaxID=239 RepID=UPI00286EB422